MKHIANPPHRAAFAELLGDGRPPLRQVAAQSKRPAALPAPPGTGRATKPTSIAAGLEGASKVGRSPTTKKSARIADFSHLLPAPAAEDHETERPASPAGTGQTAAEQRASFIAASAARARTPTSSPPPPAGSVAAFIVAAAAKARTPTAAPPAGSTAAKIIAAGRQRRGEIG